MRKVFSKQFRECTKDGNLLHITDINDDILLVCYKYKTICRSSVCKHERL